MKKIRAQFVVFMYQQTQKNYRRFFKKTKRQWQFSEEQLLTFHEDSLGRKLGEFYEKHGFRMIPKMENHDVYHLLTNYSTTVQDEVSMQYLLFGNGKRSAYLLGTLFLGTLVFPEYLGMYLQAYKKGKKMKSFHSWDFEELLWQNFEHLKLFIEQKKPISYY